MLVQWVCLFLSTRLNIGPATFPRRKQNTTKPSENPECYKLHAEIFRASLPVAVKIVAYMCYIWELSLGPRTKTLYTIKHVRFAFSKKLESILLVLIKLLAT